MSVAGSLNLNLVLNIGGILATVPFYGAQKRKFLGHRVHALYMSLLCIGICLFTIYNSLRESGFSLGVQGGTAIIFSLSNIVIFYGSCSSRIPKYQQLFDTLTLIDINFSNVQKQKPPKLTKIRLRFLTAFLFLTLMTLYDFIYYHFFTNFSLNFVVYYTYERIYILYDIMLQYYILSFVTLRLKCLVVCVDGFDGLFKIGAADCKGKLRNLMFVHRKICDVMIVFNELFSWRDFVIVFYTFTGIIKNIFYTITDGGPTPSVEYLCNIVITQALMIVQLIFLTSTCEAVSQQQENLTTASHRLCIKHLETTLEKLCKGLFKQCLFINPKISAGGFFDINNTMLFMIINLVMTYTIVLIQFIPLINNNPLVS